LGLFPSNYVEVIAAPPRSRGKEEPPATLEEKVMHAFCLLETFGNAKLMGNDNSTRDGCVFTLAVDRRGRLRHGAVTNFMVEQMRVTHQESHCYGFHVVYRVLAKVNAQGTNEEKKLFLSQPLNFLRKSTTDMREEYRGYENMCEDMRRIGFSSDDMKAIEDVLKGILALGNIDFVNFVNAGTEISKESRPYLEFASRSLGIKEQILEALLTGTLSPAYGDNPGRMLCKSIASEAFSLVFEYVLQTINESLGAGGSNGDISSVRYAVLVDLPGFEYLGEKNTIEQVSINFASEALQSVYEEQAIGLVVGALNMVAESPRSNRSSTNKLAMTDLNLIFKIIESQKVLKDITDRSIFDKVCGRRPPTSSEMNTPRKSKMFMVVHYMGRVTYSLDNFTTHYGNEISDKARSILKSSKNAALSSILSQKGIHARQNIVIKTLEQMTAFAPKQMEKLSGGEGKASPSHNMRRKSRRHSRREKKLAVSGQLEDLIGSVEFKNGDGFASRRKFIMTLTDALQRLELSYILCVKPSVKQNLDLSAFELKEVERQLQWSRILSLANIATKGCSECMPLNDFINAYGNIIPPHVRREGDLVKDSKLIVKHACTPFNGIMPKAVSYDITDKMILFNHAFRTLLNYCRVKIALRPSGRLIAALFAAHRLRTNFKSIIATCALVYKLICKKRRSRIITEAEENKKKPYNLRFARTAKKKLISMKRRFDAKMKADLTMKSTNESHLKLRAHQLSQIYSLFEVMTHLEENLSKSPEGKSPAPGIGLAQKIASIDNTELHRRPVKNISQDSYLAEHIKSLSKLCMTVKKVLQKIGEEIKKSVVHDSENLYPANEKPGGPSSRTEEKCRAASALLKKINPAIFDVESIIEVKQALQLARQLQSLQGRVAKALSQTTHSDSKDLRALLSESEALEVPLAGPTKQKLLETLATIDNKSVVSSIKEMLSNVGAQFHVLCESGGSLEELSSLTYTGIKQAKSQISSLGLTLSGANAQFLHLAENTRNAISKLQINRNRLRKGVQQAKRAGGGSSAASEDLGRIVEASNVVRGEMEDIAKGIKAFDDSGGEGIMEWLAIHFDPLIKDGRQTLSAKPRITSSLGSIASSATGTKDLERDSNLSKNTYFSNDGYTSTRTSDSAASVTTRRRTRNSVPEFKSKYHATIQQTQRELEQYHDCYENGDSDPRLLLQTLLMRQILSITDPSHLVRIAVSAFSPMAIPRSQQISMLESLLKVNAITESATANLPLAETNIALIKRLHCNLMIKENDQLKTEFEDAYFASQPKTPRDTFPCQDGKECMYEVATKESVHLRMLKEQNRAKEKKSKPLPRASFNRGSSHNLLGNMAKRGSRMRTANPNLNQIEMKVENASLSSLVSKIRKDGLEWQNSLPELKEGSSDTYQLIKEDSLEKRGENNTKFKPRLFRLVQVKDDYFLKYYEEQKKGERWRGDILLSAKGVSVELGERHEQKQEFILKTANRDYHLRAMRPKIAREWVKAINERLEAFTPKSFLKQKQVLGSISQMVEFVREKSRDDEKDFPDIGISSSSLASLDEEDYVDTSSTDYGFEMNRYYPIIHSLSIITGEKPSSGPKNSGLYTGFDLENTPDKLYMDGSKIRAATLEKCVMKATADGINETQVEMILTNFPISTTQMELLKALIKRYCVPTPLNLTSEELEDVKKTMAQIRIAVLLFINIWLRTHSSDFTTDTASLKKHTSAFLNAVMNAALSPSEVEIADQNLTYLHNINASVVKRLHSIEELESAGSGVPEKRFEKVKPTEFAEQVTLLHFAIYQSITSREFLKTGWSKEDKHKRSPYIVKMTEHFIALSHFVQKTICEESDVRRRAASMTKWLEIGEACFEMQNYHAAGAIHAGLSSNAVHRMKKTKEQVGKKLKIFEKLEKITSRKGNSKDYRELLEKAFSSCVPFLPTFCGFLEKTETAHESQLFGTINWNKHQCRSDTIIRVLRFQTQEMQYRKIDVDPPVQSLLAKVIQVMDKDEEKEFIDRMWNQSLLNEPRDPAPQ